MRRMPLFASTGLLVAASRGLCEDRAARGERSNKHGNNDQFLYHLGMPPPRLVSVWGFGLYH